MKQQGEFKADPELNRQLVTLERTVKQAFEDSDQHYGARYKPTPIMRADYNAQLDELVLCDPTGGAFSVFLPDAQTHDSGREIIVKKATTSATAITIRPSGGVTINGAASSWALTASGAYARLIWGGDSWWVC